jgi:hypothetical protein
MSDSESEIDLFEHPDQQPDELRVITDEYSYKFAVGESDPYELCRNFLSEVQELGYTFEYGLDGEPYELRRADDEELDQRPSGPSL